MLHPELHRLFALCRAADIGPRKAGDETLDRRIAALGARQHSIIGGQRHAAIPERIEDPPIGKVLACRQLAADTRKRALHESTRAIIGKAIVLGPANDLVATKLPARQIEARHERQITLSGGGELTAATLIEIEVVLGKPGIDTPRPRTTRHRTANRVGQISLRNRDVVTQPALVIVGRGRRQPLLHPATGIVFGRLKAGQIHAETHQIRPLEARGRGFGIREPSKTQLALALPFIVDVDIQRIRTGLNGITVSIGGQIAVSGFAAEQAAIKRHGAGLRVCRFGCISWRRSAGRCPDRRQCPARQQGHPGPTRRRYAPSLRGDLVS